MRSSSRPNRRILGETAPPAKRNAQGSPRTAASRRAEERRADADVGGAVGDGGLEVVAHAHREAGEAVAGGERWRAARSAGRGRRRAGGSPSGRRPAGRRGRGRRRGSASRPSGSTPAFCGSRPVLTWTKSVGQRAAGLHRGGELAGEAVAVEAVDGGEELERAGELVGLQRADEVQCYVREAGAELRPARLGLLHAVLAEDALARRQHGRAPGRAAAAWRRRPG